MVDRIKYYRIGPKEQSIKAVAYTPESVCMSSSKIVKLSSQKGLPFAMELHSVYVTDKLMKGGLSDAFMDMLSNNLGYTMLSVRIKRIIDSHLTGHESLRWLSVLVKGKTQDIEYILTFHML